MGHPNLSPMIGAVVSNRLATLKELQTDYGSEDLFDLYEVLLVKWNNETVIYDRNKNK